MKSKLSYLWGFAILLMVFGLPNVVRALEIESDCSGNFKVSLVYSYDGTTPEGAVVPEEDFNHSEREVVNLSELTPKVDTKLNGYIFDGWKVKELKYFSGSNYVLSTQKIDVVDGKFTIPNNSSAGYYCSAKIYLEGSWTKLYNLNYQFDGDQPEGYKLPENGEYVEGEKVNLDDLEVGTEIGGYRFLGWKMNGNEMKDNSFEMPGSDVTITSVWAKLYDVKYKIEGEVPEGYELPENGQYIQGENVSMDSLKAGDVIGGYRFLGWKTKDGKTVDANFEMPAGNVELVGLFEKIETKENADNPKTFDNIMFYGTLLLVSVGIISVLYRKIIKN